MLGQLFIHLKESLVVSKVGRQVLQVFLALPHHLLLLTDEVAGYHGDTLHQIQLFLLHLFTFP